MVLDVLSAQGLGLLGLFLFSVLSNASIIFPIPSFLAVIAAGSVYNPLAAGLAAGFGAAIGELTGYAVGRGGNYALQKRWKRWFRRGQEWFEKKRGFAIILIFSATPLPHDVAGILSGAVRYDVRKYFIATFIGRAALFIVLAYAGSAGIDAVTSFFTTTASS